MTDPKNKPEIQTKTASSFGYLWTHAKQSLEQNPEPYHALQMEEALRLPPAKGLILDAGCGNGMDLVQQARRGTAQVIGIELSDGGARTSYQRARKQPNAHVLQGNLTRLPFAGEQFDFIYSYGVLHHLSHPETGFKELVRVLKPGGRIAVYLYEDFSERSFLWRWLLKLANSARRITTRIPSAWLYRFCQIASPLVFLLFTLPHRILRRVPGFKQLAESIPFRHGAGPFRLAGDLYDRFAAPVEYRYSREKTLGLFRAEGLKQLSIVQQRGWMATGVKPVHSPQSTVHNQNQ